MEKNHGWPEIVILVAFNENKILFAKKYFNRVVKYRKEEKHLYFKKQIQYIMSIRYSSLQHLLRTSVYIHQNRLTPYLRFEITNSQIAKCPFNHYKKEIFVISTPSDEYKAENRNAINKILTSKIVGFDTETTVIFHKKETFPIALIQLATDDTVVLWRLRRHGTYIRNRFPVVLKRILKDKDIRKVIPSFFVLFLYICLLFYFYFFLCFV